MNFDFFMPAKILAGDNIILNSSNIIGSFGKKCLIVTGGNSAKLCGALDDVIGSLEKSDTQYEIFDKISANPQASVCFDGGEAARKINADFVFGIGGGSALDSAKAIAFYATNPDISAEGIYSYKNSVRPLPLLLAGTTAGTGSEVTGVSVLTRENGQKKSVSGKDFYSAISFADPKYTYSMPYSVTVSTALDAFSHAAEGYFASSANPMSDSFAEKALPTLFDALEYFYETNSLPDKNMRDDIYFASVFAGLELNMCKAGFPHAMGYALTEDYGLPHGRACTAFLPTYIARGIKYEKERSESFFNICGTDFKELSAILNFLTSANDIKMTEEQIKTYCSRWNGNANFNRSPGGFTTDDAEKTLTELFLK